jgi:hypothetical protein
MAFDEEIVLGQAERQNLPDEAIRFADNLRRWEPPDISACQTSELSLGWSVKRVWCVATSRDYEREAIGLSRPRVFLASGIS